MTYTGREINDIYEGADLMRMLNGYYIGNSSTCTYCDSGGQETCSNDCSGIVTQISSKYNRKCSMEYRCN